MNKTLTSDVRLSLLYYAVNIKNHAFYNPKINRDPLKSSEHINENGAGPHRGFGYYSFKFSNMEPKELLYFCLQQDSLSIK